MSQEGTTKIKAKLQELKTLIQEETLEQRKEIKQEILAGINEIKTAAEERFQAVGEKYGDNIIQFIGTVEDKASKAQHTLKDKISRTLNRFK